MEPEDEVLEVLPEEELVLLKAWIINRAWQLSEADPDVLADYIIAILNNRMTAKEMVKFLSESLSEFLEKHEDFAGEIVETIESKAYRTWAIANNFEKEAQNKKAEEEETDAPRATEELFKPDSTSNSQAPSGVRGTQPIHQTLPRHTPEQSSAERDKVHEHLKGIISARPKGKTIILTNLPQDKLEEAVIRSYFARFGEIACVKLNREFRTGEIEFTEPKFAKKAWSNPDPIFDNRFIKVYFKQQPPAQESFDLEAFKAKQNLKQREFEEKQAKKKERDDKLRQVIELKEKMLTNFELELISLEEQLKTQPEREPEIRERVSAIQKSMNENGVSPDAIEADRARLENRTPVFTGRGRGRGRGRGAFRGRGVIRGRGGRGGFSPYNRVSNASPSRRLDLRTKTITITNLKDADNESFQRALGVFGKDNIEEVKPKDGGVNITFKARYLAEKFLNERIELAGMPALEKVWDESARLNSESSRINEQTAPASSVANVDME